MRGSSCIGVDETYADRCQKLRQIVAKMQSVLVAFSGGLDSSVMLAVAADMLGDRCIGVTFASVAFPESELQRARKVARIVGVQHVVERLDHLSIPGFVANTPERCYHCKRVLFSELLAMMNHYGLAYVADGTVTDDAEDFRPGARAVRELGIRSPLSEAGLNKADVNRLACEMRLPTAGLPSMACLASRIPYGTTISLEVLRQIDEAETALRNLGFTQVRVRHVDECARIEVLPTELPMLVDEAVRNKVISHFTALGFKQVVADLRGYRTGSMNDAVTEEETSSG